MTTINTNKPATTPAKQGAKIGAWTGAAIGGIKLIKNRQLIVDTFQSDAVKTLPKGVKIASGIIGGLIALGLTTGITSAIGAGIGKIVDLFKKNDTQKTE